MAVSGAVKESTKNIREAVKECVKNTRGAVKAAFQESGKNTSGVASASAPTLKLPIKSTRADAGFLRLKVRKFNVFIRWAKKLLWGTGKRTTSSKKIPKSENGAPKGVEGGAPKGRSPNRSNGAKIAAAGLAIAEVLSLLSGKRTKRIGALYWKAKSIVKT